MFLQHKKTFLAKIDKSKIGKIDKRIKNLLDKINSNPHYYTTSSCSGRIVLISKKSELKNEASWLFVSHEKADPKDIIKALENLPKEEIWFRFEPLILHVCADTIGNAQLLVNMSRNLGLKRTGIQSTSKKICIEICGTEFIDTLVAKEGKILVSIDYLNILVEEANKKMERNLSKIKNFEKEIEKL